MASSSRLDLFDYFMPTPEIIKTASTSSPSSSTLDLIEYMPTPKIIKTASTSLPSSSSASPQNLKWTYDVFLSFRGDDTRNNFVDHLFMNLTQKGINTFRDDEKLERGKEISGDLLKAIEESRFAIIIFSENYASSSWCLDELVKIIDCTKETGQIAYPVFYNVDPSNVRNQKESFAKAFDEHEKKNLALEKMEKWKKALSQAGNLSGWDTRNRPETKIIQKIVAEIFYKLSCALLHVDDNLVGMEIRMKEINTRLNTGSNDVKFVGIHGLGGIGKTTTAKVIYNQISYQFKGCCYLANIRERCEMERNLVSLQKQLLYDILKVEVQIGDDDSGSSIIQHRLKKQKVLIILDDVAHENQLEKLAGNGEWFGPGSRIIITTRDQNLLSKYEGVQRYEVRECDSDKSLEIFSWKAFNKNHPPEDYMELSNDVVHYTKGLPLALTVLGSHLRKKSKDAWRGAIDQLSIIPNRDINDILKISYEGLEELQKNVFLDIACFFNGEDKDKVMEKLDSFGFFPSINIQDLIDKSLITVSAENKFLMHDLVRDMGRYIVREESPQNPEKRSRLWNAEDILRVLEKNMATEAIEGIQYQHITIFDRSFKAEAFMKMKNLRFLEWKFYHFEHLALDFPHDKLVHLSLRGSYIKLLWNGRKVLPHLKSIDLFCSEYLREFPDVTGLPYLERLSLRGCRELVKIHPSVWVHKGLKFLDLGLCYNFESFLNKIEMESLETLDLCRCYKMKEFPEVHGNMKRLSKLVLSLTKIKELPSSICKLKYLEQLNLNGCSALEKLPENIEDLESLVELHASKTAIKEVPVSIQFLDKLRVLSFSGCRGLKLSSFYGLPSSLTELDLSGCRDLNLSSFYGLPSSLTGLDLSGCRGLNLSSFYGLPSSLTELDLSGCRDLNLSSFYGLPSSLTELDLSGCRDLNLSSFYGLPSSLTELDLSGCRGLNLSSFYGLPSSLTKLDLSGCRGLKLSSFYGLPSSLTELDLSGCRGLNLSSFYGLPSSLTELDLSGCRGLNLSSFYGLPSSLTELDLSGCRGLNLPSFYGLPSSLKELDLSGCRGLKLPSFYGLPSSLTELDLSGCRGLKLPSFYGLPSSLTELDLSGCRGLKLSSFYGLPSSLTELDLSGCRGLKLPSFYGLPSSLTKLDLSDCDLTDETFPSNIECLSSLETLDLRDNNFVSLPTNISQFCISI